MHYAVHACLFFFFSSRRRHTRFDCDWSSDVCSSDLYAFYDQQIPKDVFSGATFDHWFREAAKENADLLRLSRDELMRHEAAGITTQAFPKVVKLGGVDCTASYLHSPGDARDGIRSEEHTSELQSQSNLVC